ncbi:MAG: MBOAT family protein, partial [Clostridia bacterium]|nr:MBOAT family protein [Clostridia bacterium]
MLVSHLLFLYVFMPALFLAYFLIKNNTYRRIVLTAFSLLFYAWGEPVAIFLMIGLVLGDYLFGLLIDHVYTAMAKRLWLIAAIAFNLSILGVYKYLGFFTETFNMIFH